MNAANKYPEYPPQISRDTPGELSLIAVVPWYAEDDPNAFFKKMEELTDNETVIEVIVVIHSFEEDADDLIKQNLDFYWLLEESKSTPPAKGLHIEAMLINGIDKRWKGSNIASYIGLAEASQHLTDARHANGGIALIDPNYQYPAGYLSILARHFSQNARCGILNTNWEGRNSQNIGASGDQISLAQCELAIKLHDMQLSRSGYPFPVYSPLFTISLRAWLFQKIREQITPHAALAPQIFHLGLLEGVDSKNLTQLTIGPSAHAIETLSRDLSDRTPASISYRAMYLLLLRSENFYRSQSLADFQEVISGLPPLARAFLKEENFYSYWFNTLIHSYNAGNFKRQFLYWLNPQRINTFFSLAAEYAPGKKLQTEAARFLQSEYGIRVQNLDPKALLEYLRSIEKGTFLSTEKRPA